MVLFDGRVSKGFQASEATVTVVDSGGTQRVSNGVSNAERKWHFQREATEKQQTPQDRLSEISALGVVSSCVLINLARVYTFAANGNLCRERTKCYTEEETRFPFERRSVTNSRGTVSARHVSKDLSA